MIAPTMPIVIATLLLSLSSAEVYSQRLESSIKPDPDELQEPIFLVCHPVKSRANEARTSGSEPSISGVQIRPYETPETVLIEIFYQDLERHTGWTAAKRELRTIPALASVRGRLVPLDWERTKASADSEVRAETTRIVITQDRHMINEYAEDFVVNRYTLELVVVTGYGKGTNSICLAGEDNFFTWIEEWNNAIDDYNNKLISERKI